MKLTVILPTYNEKVNIEKMIPVLEEEVFPKVKGHDLTILVVDDHSPDGTAEVVKKYQEKWKNLHLLEGDKQGLGVAYVRGMHHAMDTMHADAVIEFDADFQHDPFDIPHLITAMDEGADYVIGSRYIPGGQIPPEWGIHRKFLSFFGGLFARLMLFTFNIHDMTSGLKLTKTSYLKRVDLDHLYSKYYAYKIHILYEIVKMGAKVKEVPIIFYERKEGSSKISRKDTIDSFLVVLKLRVRDSKRVIKFLIVGGTGFLVQLITQELSVRIGLALFLSNTFSPLLYYLTNHYGIVALRDAFAGGIGAESAILSNFLWNNIWTFKDTSHIKERSNLLVRLLKFNFASMASILIQASMIWTFVRMLGDTLMILSYPVPTRIVVVIPTIIFIIIPLNYFIYNRFVWKTQYLQKHGNTKKQD